MNTKPLVSVIVPAFNAQDLIGETIDSILAQTYENLEIIVVDDGSTDRTSQVVRGYGSRVRFFYQENSGGCAVPRNTGIMHSSGEFLCFLDADDLMLPGRIASQVDFMNRHPEAGVVFCNYLNFNEDGPFAESHFQTCPRLCHLLMDKTELILDNPCDLLAQENFGITGSFLIRREMLSLEAGFEPTLKACEDFHFYFRLARQTRVSVINEVGMMRRLHGENMSGNPEKMLSERIRSRTMLRDSEEDPIVRAHLNRHIAECQGAFARFCADQGRYTAALQKEWQALSCNLCWSGFLGACRNLARTLMMAMGLHTPKTKCS